jgi:diaminohydroxyphosphoribosylaminopyrimidine deaminase / 5-amino-6-(5-phosphoribosylamino)uracil reductase|uniref:bifunctional diaminohydroxyphosphoribosylaminopyrimidine deaminase/5-amino-6-(5-phosphoribosylamino)uracil reductase RibD n=1 Tax=Candidatus Planktophila sp. TaxID=2175601 RepID=UPI00404A125F
MNQVFSAEAAMACAIECARAGLGKTFPNPIVGAVITSATGEFISEGFHQGADHAEVVAIKAAKAIPAGSIIYVTLEPCNHQGKTPPCTAAIIDAGIKKVIYAVSDPNPVAAGGGEYLRASGVEVEHGLLESEAAFDNRAWLTKIAKQRPRISWKIASTMDGKVAAADGTSKWITSELARADVALLRSQVDAIVTSTATVKADNPLLTSKGAGQNPVRIVMGGAEIASGLQILNSDAETIAIKSRDLQELITLAKARGFNQLLIESGPTLGTALLKADLIDEVILYQAPTFFGSGTPAISDLGVASISQRLDFEIADVEVIGTDLKITLVKSANLEESGR